MLDEQKELNCLSLNVLGKCMQKCCELAISVLAPNIFDVGRFSTLIASLPRANELLGLLGAQAAVLMKDLRHATTNVSGHAKTIAEENNEQTNKSCKTQI